MEPLDLAIIRGRLQQIADEMDLVHSRAAFSPVVSEMNDRANSIIDPGPLEVVSQGTTGLPIFVSTMQATSRAIMKVLGGDLRDGDVVVMNDPYSGGTHLQDIRLLRPWFVDGKLELLLVNTGHYVDVGSASAGGFDPNAMDIFQEGLFLPPTFLCREGELREDVLRLILRNTRLPELQEGDVRAQMNALDVGVRRLNALVEERGIVALNSAKNELARRSEEQMRGYLRRVPDGTYRARDFVEISATEELTVELALIFKDGSVVADFTGTSPSYIGPMNLARPTTETSVLLAFKHLFPEVPINGGCFRPFSFILPDGCFLNAQHPQAVGGFPESSQRVVESVFAALANALPDISWGGSFGIGGTMTIAGKARDGSFFATVFPMCGGHGGSRGSDGLMHAPTPIGMARFPKLEASEHDFPIRWEAMEILPDTGGAGQWRGGPASLFRLRALVPMQVAYLGDRARHRPHGVLGGKSGAVATVEIHASAGLAGGPGLSRVGRTLVEAGDWMQMTSPGGGGYGPPARRDQNALAADLADGIITPTGIDADWEHPAAAE